MFENSQIYKDVLLDSVNSSYASNNNYAIQLNTTEGFDVNENITEASNDGRESVDNYVVMWSNSIYPSGYSQLRIIMTSFVVTAIMILIVVGNMLVCIAIATEKSLKTVQNWFIASLAVSDFLVGLIIMPFSLAKEVMGYWIFGRVWCEIHSALDVFLCTASINSLCLISLDRYWSVTHAVEYLKKRTPRRSMAMICFVWVISAVISLPPLVGWKKPEDTSASYPTCQLSDDVAYVLCSALGSFYIPAFVMVFVYCRIFVAARSRARRHLKKQAAAISIAEYTNDPIKEKSTTTTTTTCTSFSNPSPTDRSVEAVGFSQNEETAKVTESNGTSNVLLSPTTTTAPEIIIEPSPEISESQCGSPLTTTKLVNEKPYGVNLEPKRALYSGVKAYSQEAISAAGKDISSKGPPCSPSLDISTKPSSLLKAPKFLKSPFGSTMSLADAGRSDVDYEAESLDDSGNKEKKRKKHKSKVKYQIEELPKKYPTTEAEKQKRRVAKARERRATLILGLIMASFILAWLPFFVLYVLSALCEECYVGDTGFAVAFWLGYCNSALNPIIYTIFNRDFRRAFRKILFK